MSKKTERELERRIEGEVCYRLAKLLFINVKVAGMANDAELAVAQKKLLKKYRPLTSGVEGGDANAGEANTDG